MAIYKPDHKFNDALNYLEKIRAKNKKSKNEELLLYYISKKSKEIEELYNELEKYKSFFQTLDSLLPNKNSLKLH